MAPQSFGKNGISEVREATRPKLEHLSPAYAVVADCSGHGE